MTRLPTGMYQPGYSVIHGVAPAVKIVCFALLVSAVAATDSFPGAVAAVTVTAAIIYLAQIDLASAFSPVVRMWGLCLLVLAVNAAFAAPEEACMRLWVFAPSLRGLMRGAEIVLRAVLAVLLGNVLVSTTSPLRLADGLERLLSPLGRLGFPTAETALALSAAIRFVPALFDEIDTLRKAQTARGARFDSRNYFEKARAIMPLILPVFVAAFRRAEALADTLEARGYCFCAQRARVRRAELELADYSALLVSAALFALEVIIL